MSSAVKSDALIKSGSLLADENLVASTPEAWQQLVELGRVANACVATLLDLSGAARVNSIYSTAIMLVISRGLASIRPEEFGHLSFVHAVLMANKQTDYKAQHAILEEAIALSVTVRDEWKDGATEERLHEDGNSNYAGTMRVQGAAARLHALKAKLGIKDNVHEMLHVAVDDITSTAGAIVKLAWSSRTGLPSQSLTCERRSCKSWRAARVRSVVGTQISRTSRRRTKC